MYNLTIGREQKCDGIDVNCVIKNSISYMIKDITQLRIWGGQCVTNEFFVCIVAFASTQGDGKPDLFLS